MEPDSGATAGAADVVTAGAADVVAVFSFEGEQAESSSVSAAAEATAPDSLRVDAFRLLPVETHAKTAR